MYVLGSLVVFMVCGSVVTVCVVLCCFSLYCWSDLPQFLCALLCFAKEVSFFSLLSVEFYVVLVLLTSFYGASFPSLITELSFSFF